MRIASFNVENLFDRARALNLDTWADGKPILEKHARINRLLNRPVYSEANKTAIKDLLLELGLEKRDDGGDWVILRQNRGKLVKRPQAGGLEIVANGRGDWIGWVELKKEPVNELAMDHTAMVIRDLARGRARCRRGRDADRARQVLASAAREGRRHALRARDGHRRQRRSRHRRGAHVQGGLRDHVASAPTSTTRISPGRSSAATAPSSSSTTPSGERLVVLVNHLKSKGFGVASDSNEKRKRQARRIKKIYERLTAEGEQNIAVVGDLNDTPDSAPLRAPPRADGSARTSARTRLSRATVDRAPSETGPRARRSTTCCCLRRSSRR